MTTTSNDIKKDKSAFEPNEPKRQCEKNKFDNNRDQMNRKLESQ